MAELVILEDLYLAGDVCRLFVDAGGADPGLGAEKGRRALTSWVTNSSFESP